MEKHGRSCLESEYTAYLHLKKHQSINRESRVCAAPVSVCVNGERLVSDEVWEVHLSASVAFASLHNLFWRVSRQMPACSRMCFFQCIQCPGLDRHTATICRFNMLTELGHYVWLRLFLSTLWCYPSPILIYFTLKGIFVINLFKWKLSQYMK